MKKIHRYSGMCAFYHVHIFCRNIWGTLFEHFNLTDKKWAIVCEQQVLLL